MQQVVVVQISDSHFGPNLLNKRFSLIRGFNEHDVTLLTAFKSALWNVRKVTSLQPNDPLFLLHTGDLTATGAHGEFAAAELYFRGERPFTYSHDGYDDSDFIGLRLPPTSIGIIPGNHDHWDGKLRYGRYNQKIFGQYFPPIPWCKVLTSNTARESGSVKKLIVELYAVDSNSGLRDNGILESAAAKGRISEQEFSRLARELESKKHGARKNELVARAFIIHHPLAPNSGNLFDKSLHSDSAAELLRLARQYKVFAILNGHTHRFNYRSYDLADGGGDRVLYELRSATTFQGPANNGDQGFIAHQIIIEDDKLWWKAWQYKFASKGFECAFIQPGDQPWWQRQV